MSAQTNLFGAAKNTNSGTAGGASNPAFSFGQQQSTTGAAGGLFGQTASTFSFGTAKKDTNTSGATAETAAGNKAPVFSFGASANTGSQQKSAFSFGPPSSAATTTSKPLFGAAPSTGALSGSTTNAPASQPRLESKPADPASGSTASAATSLFGAATGNSLFGAPASKPTDKPLFGAASTAKPASTSLFGASASNSSEKPLFGAPASASAGTNKPLFGSLAPASDKPADKPADKPLFGAPQTSKETDRPLFGGSTVAGSKDKPLFGAANSSANTPLFGAASTDKSGDKPENKFNFGATSDKPLFGVKKNETAQAKTPTVGENSEPQTSSSDKAAPASQPTDKSEITPSVFLKNKSFEDIIAKWTLALHKSKERFEKQAEEIAAWDRVLVTSGGKIADVYAEVASALQSQVRIDDVLTYIDKQQTDLEALLDKYEQQASALLPDGMVDTLLPVDQERHDAYKLADELNGKLDTLEESMSSVIAEINKVSKDVNHISDEDPIVQIVKILNSHMASLRWIDENANELQSQLTNAYAKKSQIHF